MNKFKTLNKSTAIDKYPIWCNYHNWNLNTYPKCFLNSKNWMKQLLLWTFKHFCMWLITCQITHWHEYIQKNWLRIYFHWNNQSKKSNIIVATIYKGMQHPKWHPKMNVIEFNKSLSNLLKKIDQEQKTVFFRRF